MVPFHLRARLELAQVMEGIGADDRHLPQFGAAAMGDNHDTIAQKHDAAFAAVPGLAPLIGIAKHQDGAAARTGHLDLWKVIGCDLFRGGLHVRRALDRQANRFHAGLADHPAAAYRDRKERHKGKARRRSDRCVPAIIQLRQLPSRSLRVLAALLMTAENGSN